MINEINFFIQCQLIRKHVAWFMTSWTLWKLSAWLTSLPTLSSPSCTRERMASDPEGQLSDQSDIPANSEVSEVVINCVVSKDNQWRYGLTITTRPSRSACRNIECTSIRACLACVAWRFCVVLSGARLSGEAAPVPVSWPAPAFIICSAKPKPPCYGS